MIIVLHFLIFQIKMLILFSLFYSSVLHFYAFAHRAALYPPMLYPELEQY